jgi:hypothetical protein
MIFIVKTTGSAIAIHACENRRIYVITGDKYFTFLLMCGLLIVFILYMTSLMPVIYKLL